MRGPGRPGLALARRRSGGETAATVATNAQAGRDVNPAMLRRVDFPTARRGYRQEEVDGLLAAAADALERAQNDNAFLRDALAEAQAEASRVPDAVDNSAELETLRDEIERLRAELERARIAADRQRTDAEGRTESLRGELLQVREERDGLRTQLDEALAVSKAPPTRAELIELVGEQVAQVLSDAEEQAEEMRAKARSDAHVTTLTAKTDADRIRREAEQQGLRIRRSAQEDADTLTAGARREADAVRREAENAARLVREEADRDATLSRREIEAERDRVTREADDYARETRAAAERDARRMRAEAEAAAEGTVRAAEQQAEEAVRDANARVREIEDDLDLTKERESAVIARLRDARDDLSQHLLATREGLDRVLAQVADDRVTGLLPMGDVIDQPYEDLGDTDPELERAADELTDELLDEEGLGPEAEAALDELAEDPEA